MDKSKIPQGSASSSSGPTGRGRGQQPRGAPATRRPGPTGRGGRRGTSTTTTTTKTAAMAAPSLEGGRLVTAGDGSSFVINKEGNILTKPRPHQVGHPCCHQKWL